MNSFLKVMNELCPCDSCNLYKKCKDNKLACNAFDQYVTHGKFNYIARTNPSEKKYIQIFLGVD